MICLSHRSAFEFWRWARTHGKARKSKRCSFPEEDTQPPRSNVDEIAAEFGLSFPLHFLARTDSRRRNSAKVRFGVKPRSIIGADFYQIRQGLYVVSPELCLVQLAKTTSRETMILLAQEFCGTYSLDPCSGKTTYNLSPLTSKRNCFEEWSRMRGTPGVAKAKSLRPFFLDGAASLRESKLIALLCLPATAGGYGFALPEANYEVLLPDKLAKSQGRKVCRGDLVWPKAKVDIEYDSTEYHNTDLAIANDAARRNALLASGFSVITVTRRQLNNVEEMDRVAFSLRRALGLRNHARPKDFRERQGELRTQLSLPR